MTRIGEIDLLAKIDTKEYERGAEKIDSTNDQIARNTETTTKKMGSSWNTASRLAAAAIVTFGAIAVKTFVDSASEIQSLRASFSSLTGNVKDTNAVMTTLYNLGKKTAFSNKDIQAAGRSYLAVGVGVKDLQKLLSQTADVAGATGADLSRLVLPLSQVIARGKLQTQDFYQILDSGAGALRKPLTEIAGKKGFGSLAEAMEKGAITSEDLLKVLSKVTKQGGFAFQGALKQSETFSGRMSNLQEAITQVGLSILGVDAITGQVNPGGIFDTMSKAVQATTDFLSNNQGMIKQVATVITILLIPAIIRLGIEGLIAGGKLAAGILLALGPIGLIVSATLAAAALIAYNWNAVKKAFIGAWTNMVNFVAKAVSYLGKIFSQLGKPLISGISAAIGTVKTLFIGLVTFFTNIWGKIKGIFTSIGKSIGGAIGGAFKGVINGIIGFVETTINGVIKSINAVAEGIDKALPGDQSGWRVPSVKLPRLAEGGIVSKATVAMIGEGSEPEAVIPLSKLDNMLENGTGTRDGVKVDTIIINRDVDIDLVARKLGIEQLQTQRGIA